MNKSDQQILKEQVIKWRNNLHLYSKQCVRLINKNTIEVPFKLNTPQEYIHERIEKQKKEKGYVRVIILKGRQQGASKYVTVRFLHATSLWTNVNTFVMAHDSKTTNSLFNDYKNMHNSLPALPVVKEQPKRSNAYELVFGDIHSSLQIGTAGSAEIGRGLTLNKFHGSEVAFWPNADKILAGIFNAIPLLPNTEIILESTANGMGNKHHQMCMDALKGIGSYELIFIPWWWTEEYEINEDIDPTDEEWEYYDTFMAKDCKNEAEGLRKLAWRRMKIIEADEKKFRQEYPATPQEAFQMSGNSLFNNEWIQCARNTDIKEDKKIPLIVGVDAAEAGGDRTAIVYRRGAKITKIVTYDEMDEMRLAGIVADIIKISKPKYVNFDKAYAGGCVGRLKELGYENIVRAVAFASRPIEPDRFLNKRAEMHWMLKEWLEEGYLEFDPDTGQGGVDIPDTEELHTDLACIPEPPPTSNGKIKMVPKEIIKKEYGMSPDILDAAILTFAQPVNMVNNTGKIKVKSNLASKKIFGE